MAKMLSKEAQKKLKAGICFRLASHNKHTSFLLSKRSKLQVQDFGYKESLLQTDQDGKVFRSILNTEGLIQKLEYLKVTYKFRGGLLGIRGFYNLMLLVQVCAAAED
ncbi:hypothetical protein Tco_1538880 [Tanacetum coccineum]